MPLLMDSPELLISLFVQQTLLNATFISISAETDGSDLALALKKPGILLRRQTSPQTASSGT